MNNIEEKNEEIVEENIVKNETNVDTEEVSKKDNSKEEKKEPIKISLVHAIFICMFEAIIIIGVAYFIMSRPIKNEPSIVKWNYPEEGSLKPIIYIYPEEEINVSIKLNNPERLTCTYPKYNNSWNVLAKPNGDLIYLENGRNLYSLYYENENIINFKVEDSGFVIKGEDSAKFLEEKLRILGLNDKEAEEFIVYWLPKLEKNNYNYIRFASEDEINSNMGLEIDPKPDTLIRVLMIFKGLENPIKVEEQELENVNRKGYSIIEWGGTEITNY